jgi:phage shock protein E
MLPEKVAYMEVYPEELEEWQSRGAQLVDVREPWEYERGHLPGARNVPLSDIPVRAGELSEPMVLVCASGNRSAEAAQYLVESGFREVGNLAGGTFGWIQRGLPIE